MSGFYKLESWKLQEVSGYSITYYKQILCARLILYIHINSFPITSPYDTCTILTRLFVVVLCFLGVFFTCLLLSFLFVFFCCCVVYNCFKGKEVKVQQVDPLSKFTHPRGLETSFKPKSLWCCADFFFWLFTLGILTERVRFSTNLISASYA